LENLYRENILLFVNGYKPVPKGGEKLKNQSLNEGIRSVHIALPEPFYFLGGRGRKPQSRLEKIILQAYVVSPIWHEEKRMSANAEIGCPQDSLLG
jgi:hypothetical protein